MIDINQPENIRFSNENVATLVRVSPGADINEIIKSLKLVRPRALLILNGSTKDLPEAVKDRLYPLFEGLAELVIKKQITVITGGTNAGIFSLFGKSLQKFGEAAAPCIGVAVAGRMHPGKFEPHHSHFVIVEGQLWGEETAVMYGLAEKLAKGRPTLAIIVGGGEVAVAEMMHNVGQNREMIFITGAQGKTDEIVAAGSTGKFNDKRFAYIIQKGTIKTFAIKKPANELIDLVCHRLISQSIL